MTDEERNIEEIKEPGSFRLILTLGIAGFLSGLLLVATFLITKPIIAKHKAEALREAIFEVLPGTESFLELKVTNDVLVAVADDEAYEGQMLYLGLDAEGKRTGFAISGAEGGYQDLIWVLYGYDPEKEMIIGLKVLDSKETPGLGDKIFKDEDFQENFKKLLVKPEIEIVKKGSKTKDNQIEAITGATISSKAINRLLNKSMEQHKAMIEQYLRKKKTSDE